jgi:hypothetical protein
LEWAFGCGKLALQLGLIVVILLWRMAEIIAYGCNCKIKYLPGAFEDLY